MRNDIYNNRRFWYSALSAFIVLVCVIAFHYIQADNNDASDLTESASSGAISFLSSNIQNDPIAIHTADLADLDISELVEWQSTAAMLPDTADLDAISYKILNNNIPYFNSDLISTSEFELYSELDDMGRCGMAISNISSYTMPRDGEERGSISSIRPSGWVSARYDGIDNGGYLYNRCHLIGYQLAAENANKLNLITGTRHLNIKGMLGFENAVAKYVRETGNHVLYAVTPIFLDNELVARGVLMEAYSVEDYGNGVQFCAFCYNNQPGIIIDYATGESKAA